MKRSFLIFSILLFPPSVFCQDIYVSLNNDTIHGKVINYKEWSRNPSAVSFKEDVTGNSISLTPYNCKSFTAGSSDAYTSYAGSRILNTDRLENTHALQSDTLTKDSIHVFLREIYRFKNYTLYKLFDDKRTNFYLADNRIIRELEYYEYLNDDRRVIFYDPYKNYLLQLFTSNSFVGLQHKVEALTYDETKLLNFFADVLGDKAHSSEKLRNKYPAEVLVGIGANENFGSILLNNGVSYHQSIISPSFDVGLRIYSQRNLGRLFFQPSVNITSFSQIFNEGFYKTKAIFLSAKLGAGYFFQRKAGISVYGALQGGLTFLFGYKTHLGNNANPYDKAGSPDDKATIYPELGIIVKRSLNIALTGMLPVKVPFVSFYTVAYKVSQVNVVVRYMFVKR